MKLQGYCTKKRRPVQSRTAYTKRGQQVLPAILW